MPIIDLAFDTDRHFIVDREPGQYLGHPTTVMLDDRKTIIAVYPKGHGCGVIVMKKSVDGGKTWSARLPTPDNWDTSMETPTIYRTIDKHGKRRLILFSGGPVPVRMSVSEDDGDTWTQLKPIGAYGGVVAMADLVRRKDGDYLAFFHDLNHRFVGDLDDPHKLSPDYLKTHPHLNSSTSQTQQTKIIWKTLSSDGGLTWGKPQIAVSLPDAGLCEPGLIRSPDGNQLAMLLRENNRCFNSFVSFSHDEGETWSRPFELPAALTGDRHQAVYMPDGRLFVSFRDMAHKSLTRGDWVGWVGTYADIADGREGQYRIRLMKNYQSHDCGYPAIEVMPDGTIMALTYGHWIPGQPPFIAGLRFKASELDAFPKWHYKA